MRLTVADIERIIGAILPKAARDPAWWSNAPAAGRGLVQCGAWLEAGFHAKPDRAGDGLWFRRAGADAGLDPHD